MRKDGVWRSRISVGSRLHVVRGNMRRRWACPCRDRLPRLPATVGVAMSLEFGIPKSGVPEIQMVLLVGQVTVSITEKTGPTPAVVGAVRVSG